MSAKTPREIEHVYRLRVELDLEGHRMPLGALVWGREQRVSFFEFDPAFMRAPLPVSPFMLRTTAGVHEAPPTPFEGLHGLFNDSLPDGWGRKLLDRRLKSLGYNERLMTPLDRLAFVGRRGMGALSYIPELSLPSNPDRAVDLDWLAEQARRVENNEPVTDISKLQVAQGGSGGVRPKILVGFEPSSGALVLDAGDALPSGFEHWIVKLRSRDDPREIGPEEYAYSLMARSAGVDMPETRLLRADVDAYFAVRRFDRTPAGRRHVHTASGLVHADHRTAGAIEYGDLLKLTWNLTRDIGCVEEMFRRMVFNVLADNRDDHAKNHAFTMTADGRWSPAPAYDITYSTGPGGEHNLAVNGEGRVPGLTHLLAVAVTVSLPDRQARTIYDDVRTAVASWPKFAQEATLSERRTDEIDLVINGRRPGPRPASRKTRKRKPAASSPSPGT
jgi:serine/threonine-protein kinase HipA